LSNGLTEYVINTRAPLLLARDAHAAAEARGIVVMGAPLCCFLAVPMISSDKVIGVLAVQDYEKENVYDEHHLELLMTIAAQATIALENARLYSAVQQELDERMRAEVQVRRRVEQLTALHAVDVAISSSLDLHLTLDVLLNQVVSQLHVDAADVLLLNPHMQTLEYAAGRGFRTTALQHTHLRLGESLAGQTALERRAIQVPDLTKEPSGLSRAPKLANEKFVAYFGVPLIAKGQVKGILEIFHRAPLETPSEWVEFLETLAGQAAIAIDNAELFNDLQRSNAELTISYDATLEGWSRALDLRDKETEGHSQRAAETTLQLARALGMDEAELVHVRRGALLHDLGKIGIPDALLQKPGPLTDEEWQVMRKHPTVTHDLLAPITYLRPALDIPYCHHEKWDGTGYPQGLKGEEIPLAARIFAVVDVWDALRSDRPYRAAWAEEKVREYIQDQAGKHFDPKVVEAFLKI
jgi:HD-GYP domain-containing protein (c-di-GMP phosphodiesterase class II)